MFRKDTCLASASRCQGERTALQRASSRANGIKFGRPRKVDDAEHITPSKGSLESWGLVGDGSAGRPEMTVEIWAIVVLVA